MKRFIILLATIATLLLGTLLPTSGALKAQASNDQTNLERITLSPAVNKPNLDSGQTSTGKITIINDGKTAYKFVVYASPFSVKGEQYDPNYTTVNKQTDAFRWIKFEQTSYTLQPGQRVDARYSITVPKDAAPGGHYAVLFAETQPPANEKVSVARKKRVGSLLYMTISGKIINSGSLESWDVQLWQKKKPVLSNIRIKNSGNVHFQANIHANYTNLFGKKAFQLNQELLILPGTTRRVPIAWENAPTFGIFKASGNVEFLGQTKNLASKYVILLPPIYLCAFLALLVLIIAVVVISKRRINYASSPKKKRQH